MNSFFHGYYSLKFLQLGQGIFSQMPGISLCCIQEINSENGYFTAEARRRSAAQPHPKQEWECLAQSSQSMSCARSKGSPSFHKAPSFPLCQRGMKGDFWIALRQTHQLGSMKISSQLANNLDYCSAEKRILSRNTPNSACSVVLRKN